MKKRMLNAQCAITAQGELQLYGVIGSWWDGLDANSIVSQLEAQAGEEIVVRIHSPGGNLLEGLAIYNRLKQSPKNVIVYIDGLAASMASAVAMAGDVIYMPDNAMMMIHKPWVVGEGNADELRRMADTLDQFQDSMVLLYAAKTGKTKDEINALLESSEAHWMNGTQAVAQGFADEVIASIQVAAAIDVKAFHNPPADLLAKLVPTPNAAPAAHLKENQAMKRKLIAVSSGGVQIAAAITTVLAAAAYAALADDALTTKLAGDSGLALDVVAKLLAGEPATDEQLDAMAKAVGVAAPQPAPQPAPARPGTSPEQAVANERTRIAGIMALGTQYGIEASHTQGWINEGIDMPEARSRALDVVAARDRSGQPASPHIRIQAANAEGLRAAMAQAVLHRYNPQANQVDDNSREFAGLTLLEMARAHLVYNGVSVTGKSRNEIATLAMQSTSDFASILADVANKTLRQAYGAAPQTFKKFCRRATASDFKNINRVQLDGNGRLEVVNESGEYQHGALVDGKESYALKTRGKIFAITRKTLINDDLDAFTRIPALFGRGAAETESDVVWALITGNVVLGDSVALFHSTHGNLGTAGAISATTLTEGRKKMRLQKGLDGATVLNLSPKFIMVPAALETTAQTQLMLVQPNSASDVNPFAGTLEILVESRIDAADDSNWFLAADPAMIDTIEYAYLAGEEGVYIETRNGFDVDGIEIKARLDFGAGVVDHRGLFKNPH